MTKVLVFGTFDIIHPGHRWFLRRASRYGEALVAVVAGDDFVRRWKGAPPLADQKARMSALIESGLVDNAVPADPVMHTYSVIRTLEPDVICLGHDQKALKDDLENWLLENDDSRRTPVIRVFSPWKRRRFSSTRLNRPFRLRGRGGLSR